MKVKGTAVAAMPEFIKEKFGSSGYQKWLNALSDRAKIIYSSKILANEWFPLKEVLTDPTQKMCDIFYGGDPMYAHECGRYSAEKGLKGIYRTFVKLGSPEFICKCASVILPTYYDPSKVVIQSLEKRQAVFRIVEFSEISKVIEYRITGWIERAIEINGGMNVSVKLVKSMCDNNPYCEFEVTWS